MKKIMCLVFIVMVVVIIAACGKSSTEYIDETGTTPQAFVFNNVTGAAVNTVITSNYITVTGITNTSTPISIDKGSYEIDDNGFTSIAGTISNGQTVRLRHTSSSTNSTTVTQTLTIGTVSGTFSSTTVAGTSTETGEQLFNSACSSCHTASSLAGTTLAEIDSNTMQKGLTTAQLQLIVNYLATVQ
jgi:cytochrome c553